MSLILPDPNYHFSSVWQPISFNSKARVFCSVDFKSAAFTASQSWKSTFFKCVWGREKVMIEEQVIPNLQSLYSQECGLIFQLSLVLYAPSRVLVHSITYGNELLLNPYNMRWAGLRVKAQRLFLSQDDVVFFYCLFVSFFLFGVPG